MSRLGEVGTSASELIALGDGGPLGDGGRTMAHRRFEQFAREDPARTAIVTRDEELTYAELDARAGRLALRLRELGVASGSVVGVCLDRRLDAIVAIYGVLKAGGAYLPLDAGQPLERRRFMLENAGASTLVTVSAWAGELASNSTSVVTVDGEILTSRNGRSQEAGDPALDDLAYVIYTSGSTGRPKGVMIEHRSLAAYVEWGVGAFSDDELRSVLAATTFAFDMSVFELFIPFAAGGRLVLVDNVFEVRDVAHREITLVNLVPSLMAALLAEMPLPMSVRTAVFCGETLPPELSERVHGQPGVERVVNAYGPTEDTVYSTAVDVPPGAAPTIGRPFPGTQAYVVDDGLNLVPLGESGELCLGGVGLARGYIGRPDLTEERFVPNPFGPGRVYRTGDLARWDDAGELHHLGRIDHQIKLRGVRIEPGEIEAAILEEPGLRQAVVVARERPSRGKWLVAYVVCDAGARLDATALRDRLRRTLLEPMIPSTFVVLDGMPLNANGKLDRARLPEPLSTRRTDAGEMSDTERDLALLWGDVLGIDGQLGPDDDFFEIGGDSLLAFTLFDRIADQFARDVPINSLVEASTVRALAQVIDSGAVERRRLARLNKAGARIPLFYVHSGAGGMLTLRNFSTAVGTDQPLFGLQAFSDRDIEVQDTLSVVETSDECLAALRELQPKGPYLLAGHSIGGHIAYEMANRLHADGERVAYVGMLDPAAPHTLSLRGRLTARAKELTGRGPEPRRENLFRTVIAATGRMMRARVTAAAPATEEDREQADTDRWMRNLLLIEQRYDPPMWSGNVTLYVTSEMARYTGSPTNGWARYVEGSLEVRRVPGGHLSMLLEPNVGVVARSMAADIDAVQLTLG